MLEKILDTSKFSSFTITLPLYSDGNLFADRVGDWPDWSVAEFQVSDN